MPYNGSQAQAGRGSTLSMGPQAPTGLVATPSGTGGTLPAGTNYYKVTAIVGGVESAGSQEASATTTGSTSSVTLSWAAVPGATSYKIYRGTTPGGENAVQTGTSSPTFTDTGSAGTAATPPTTGTQVGETNDVPFARPEWQFDDTTNLQSGSDEEMIVTIRKSAEFSIKINRVSSDAGQTAVESAYQAGSLQAFTLQLPKTPSQTTKGDLYSWNAYVIGSDIDISPTKKIAGTLKLKTSGPVTLALGS